MREEENIGIMLEFTLRSGTIWSLSESWCGGREWEGGGGKGWQICRIAAVEHCAIPDIDFQATVARKPIKITRG